MAYTVILDPGHGGYDNGAVYFGRMEKYDNLDLALAVGEILDSNGVNVLFTRTEDVYVSPLERAYMANMVPADYFVSIHRNSSQTPNTYSGVQSLVYNMNDPSRQLAENLNKELEELGFTDLGIAVRTDLAVLRRTVMPSVLVEVGFINSDSDNTLFDERFDEISYAIATAILDSLGVPPTNEGEPSNDNEDTDNMMDNRNRNMNGNMNDEFNGNMNGNMNDEFNGNMNGNMNDEFNGNMNGNMNDNFNRNRNNTNGNMDNNMNNSNNPNNNMGNHEESEIDTDYQTGEGQEEQPTYHIQLGLFRDGNNARNLVNNLNQAGYMADIISQGELYAVVTGEFDSLDEAQAAEDTLRQQGYSTLIVRNGNR